MAEEGTEEHIPAEKGTEEHIPAEEDTAAAAGDNPAAGGIVAAVEDSRAEEGTEDAAGTPEDEEGNPAEAEAGSSAEAEEDTRQPAVVQGSLQGAGTCPVGEPFQAEEDLGQRRRGRRQGAWGPGRQRLRAGQPGRGRGRWARGRRRHRCS